MLIKFDTVELVVYPAEFSVTLMDIDDPDATFRADDATLNRDRIAVKRQIDFVWPALTWANISTLLTAMSPVFVDVYYPDPETGGYETKTFYTGNRPALVAFTKNGTVYWSGLKATFTEQ